LKDRIQNSYKSASNFWTNENGKFGHLGRIRTIACTMVVLGKVGRGGRSSQTKKKAHPHCSF